jgi:hypothetical protein
MRLHRSGEPRNFFCLRCGGAIGAYIGGNPLLRRRGVITEFKHFRGAQFEFKVLFLSRYKYSISAASHSLCVFSPSCYLSAALSTHINSCPRRHITAYKANFHIALASTLKIIHSYSQRRRRRRVCLCKMYSHFYMCAPFSLRFI